TPGREHVPMFADLLKLRSLAETRHIGVDARVLVATPGVIGAGDLRDVIVRHLTVGAVHQRSQLARVNEKRFTATVAETSIHLVPREKPEADWNLRRVEELARQRHHAVD